MSEILAVYNFIVSQGPDILVGLLAGLGALKILADVSPWTWDEKALAQIEKALNLVKNILPKKKEN